MGGALIAYSVAEASGAAENGRLAWLRACAALVGRTMPATRLPGRANHAIVRSGCCADLLSVCPSERFSVWLRLFTG